LDPRDRDFISELLHSKIATGGGGESSKIETTSLRTVEETLDAPGRAQTVANRPPGNSRAACRLPATASYLAKSECSALRVPRFARTIAACRFAERLEQLLKAVECSRYLSVCTYR
jgi:hypothetical protein